MATDWEQKSVMFLDVKGYSKLQKDHQEKYFKEIISAVKAILDDYGAEHQNTWGDAVVATFKIPTVAVNCALDICEKVHSKGKPNAFGHQLQARIAVHSIETGLVTNDIRGCEDIVGPGVNLVARMEAAGVAGDVIVGETLVGGSDDWEGESVAFSVACKRTLPKGAKEQMVRIARRFKSAQEKEDIESFSLVDQEVSQEEVLTETNEEFFTTLEEVRISKDVHDDMNILVNAYPPLQDELERKGDASTFWSRYEALMMEPLARAAACGSLGDVASKLAESMSDLEKLKEEDDVRKEDLVAAFGKLGATINRAMTVANRELKTNLARLYDTYGDLGEPE